MYIVIGPLLAITMPYVYSGELFVSDPTNVFPDPLYRNVTYEFI